LNTPGVVAFGNVAEYHNATELFGDKAAEPWIRNAAAISPLSLFWSGCDSLAIVEEPQPAPVFSRLKKLFPLRNFEMITTGGHPEKLSEAILCDSILFKRLAASFRRGAFFEPWGGTSKLEKLLVAFEEEKALPQNFNPLASGQSWRRSYLGAKSGFRDFSTNRGFPLPEGWVFSSLDLAIGAAANCALRGEGVVIKAERGVGGACQLFSPPSSSSDKTTIEGRLEFYSRRVPELRRGAVVVERRIEGGLSLSGQGFCDGKGGFSSHFLARQLHCVLPGGAMVGKGTLRWADKRKLSTLLKETGRAVSRFGYRGVLGVDFVTDSEGEVYMVEFNPRRTTLSHAAPLACGLLGEGWQERRTLLIPAPIEVSCSPEALFDKLEGSLFLREKGEGILVTSFTKTGLITTAIFGCGPERCVELSRALPVKADFCSLALCGVTPGQSFF